MKDITIPIHYSELAIEAFKRFLSNNQNINGLCTDDIVHLYQHGLICQSTDIRENMTLTFSGIKLQQYLELLKPRA